MFLRYFYLGVLEESYSRLRWGQVCPGKAEQHPLQLQVEMTGGGSAGALIPPPPPWPSRQVSSYSVPLLS